MTIAIFIKHFNTTNNHEFNQQNHTIWLLLLNSNLISLIPAIFSRLAVILTCPANPTHEGVNLKSLFPPSTKKPCEKRI